MESAAERKLREQIEKTRQKEAEKASLKDGRHAQALLAKIEPAIASVEALLNHNHIALISDAFVNPVKEHLDQLCKAAGLARRIVKDGRTRNGEELMTITGISAELAALNKAKTLLTQMLAACSKAGRS